MTETQRRQLLKELSARLPYGVIVKNDKLGIEGKLLTVSNYQPACGYILTDIASGNQEYTLIEDVKPYLRPMSSMTEEEQRTLDSMCNGVEMVSRLSGLKMFDKAFDWLNERHFDYHGLIPMGLALEAPEGMYNLE